MAFYEFYRTGITDSITSTFILPEVTDESKWLAGKHHCVDTKNHILLYEGNVSGTSMYYDTSW